MTKHTSKESSAFTFKGQNMLFGCLTFEDEGATLVSNVDNHSSKARHIP